MESDKMTIRKKKERFFMKVYNTLTRQKEELQPITPGEVKIYACLFRRNDSDK